MIRTILKNLAARKLRLVTTGVAVMLGVAFMAGTLILTDTLGRTFDTLFADVNAGVDAYVRSDQAVGDGMGAPRDRIDERVVAAVAAVDGVAAAEGTVRGYAQVLGRDGQPIGGAQGGPPTYGGNWLTDDGVNPFTLAEGRAPAGAGEVVVDRASAAAGDLAVGDRTAVLTQGGRFDVTVVGVARFGRADSPGGASYALFDLPTAQRLVAVPGEVDGVRVAGEAGVSEDDLADRIEAVVPGGLEVLTGTEITAEDRDSVAGGLDFFNAFLLTFALVALFVGSFIIYNTFTILVAQRGRETALLRAIGASRRQVLASVLGEAVGVGLVASVVGVAAGVGVAGLLRATLAAVGVDLPEGGLVVAGGTIVTAVATGVLVTVASSLLPARRASRTPPVAAMRDASLEVQEHGRRRVAAGAGVVAAGVASIGAGLFAGAGTATAGAGVAAAFAGVIVLGPALAPPLVRVLGAPLPRLRGLAGRLGRENAAPNPRRTAATASALMIGVGLVGSMTVLTASAKASVDDVVADGFAGDVVVDSGTMGFGGLSPALAGAIADLPEVAAVTGVRGTTVEIDGRGEQLVGLDAAAVDRIFDLGSVDGSFTDLGTGRIAVSRAVADRRGLSVGDQVAVRFAATGEQQLEVAAVHERDDLVGPWVVGLTVYEANVAEQLDVKVFVDGAPGVPAGEVEAAVAEVASAYPQAAVHDRDGFVAAAGEHFDQMLNLVNALLLLAIAVALIGVANTLALSVVERTRELGLLRAVGMTRRQLREAIRWESVLVALLGTVLGLGVGTGAGWVLVRALASQGVTAFRVPAAQLVTIAVLAAVAGVVAAVLPARRAARLDVLSAIANG